MEHRYFAVTGEQADEETLDHLIETGESETIFQKAMMEQGRGQILDTVAEIQERHNAVKELERKLLELHQIFLDMSVLVERRGEMLDNIENQVSKSVDYVHKGQVSLIQARKYQKSSRKWMCCSLICVLMIACAILLPVLQPWASGSAWRRLDAMILCYRPLILILILRLVVHHQRVPDVVEAVIASRTATRGSPPLAPWSAPACRRWPPRLTDSGCKSQS